MNDSINKNINSLQKQTPPGLFNKILSMFKKTEEEIQEEQKRKKEKQKREFEAKMKHGGILTYDEHCELILEFKGISPTHDEYWEQLNKERKEIPPVEKEIFLIRQHIRVLSRKYEQCFNVDDYANKSFQGGKWYDDINYFRKKILKKCYIDQYMKKCDYNSGELMKEFDRLSKLILNEIEVYSSRDLQYDETMSGIDYEKFCKSILEKSSWTCSLTPQSGDQGGDIIAQKQNKVVIFQCKHYTASVGNKAIQEVHAAKSFYKADDCAVVSNTNYTKSAKELARSLNVLLLHHTDLDNI